MLKFLAIGVLIVVAGGTLIWLLVQSSGKEECFAVKKEVKNLRYVEMNNGDLKLEWDPPDEETVSKYIISVSSDWGGRSVSYETNRPNYVFSDVFFCTTYTFLVTANSHSDYTFKGVSLVVRTRDIVPENPKNLTVDMKNKVVQWTSNANHCVRGYHLKLFNSEMCIKDIILPQFASSYEFQDVTTCSHYVITFQTLGSNATRSAVMKREVSPVVVDYQSGNFVQNLRYETISTDKIILKWNTPVALADCVHDYAITIPNYRTFPLLTTRDILFNISGLNSCMEYQVFVAARTIHKEFIGKSSELIVKISSLENQIESLSFNELNGNLHVKWKAPVTTINCVELYTLDICAINTNILCRRFKPNVEVGGSGMVAYVPDISPCVLYKISISILSTDKHFAFYSEVYQTQPRVFEPPVFRSIHNISSHSAILKWGMRDPIKNHCKLSSSILECTMDGNSFMSYEFMAKESQQEIITEASNLMPYANYSCYLTFSQLSGRSEKSREVQFITLEDVPSMVRNLSMINTRVNALNVRWQPPKYTNGILKAYLVQVKNVRRLYETPSWCGLKIGEVRKTTLSPDLLSYEVEKLDPFEEYVVSISAATSVGYGQAAEITATTLPAVPGVVSQPQYTPASPSSYIVSWKQPCRANGILKVFRVMVTGTRGNHPDDTFSYSIMPNTSYPDTVYSVRLPKLRPVYKYQIAISASVENVPDFGAAVLIEMSTPPSLPPVPHAEELLGKVRPVSVLGRNGTQYKVTMTKDMFEDSGGDLIFYALIIGQDLSLNNKMDSGSTNILKEWPSMSNWAEASQYNFVFPYQATPPYWNPFESTNQNDSLVFVIGEDVFCESLIGGYCNGPLKPETKYSMKIRAFTAAGYQDSPPLKFTTGSEIEHVIHANYLLAACVFLFLGFLVGALYYVRTRHIPVFEQVTQRMNGRRKLIVVPSKSIPVKRFPEFYSKIEQSSQILKMEFNELHAVSAQLTSNLSNDVARRCENFKKNRYGNVLPYDDTRVKIIGEHGDYINASFIEGVNKTRAYIACQGPLSETFTDFWTMILQYDINVIVMLCQITENNKTVCEKYFPEVDQTLTFDGGISVECTMMTSNSLYEERKIIVTNINKELTVSHIKFLEWPDFGIPSDPEILVNFCNAVRKLWNDKPIVVHCSAGIGRTGTFIACDILLQQLPKNKFVNIFDTVIHLRKQRPGMVQSVAQYIYLYDCVFNGIKQLNKVKRNDRIVKS